MTYRSLFGAVVVLLLLFLYVLLTASAISLLKCTPPPPCGTFSESKASALSLIAGLVSAVVIAELALTTPKKQPFRRLLGETPSKAELFVLAVVTFLYLGAWLFVGIWALVETWQKPETIPALTALARSWFGLVVAAGYAYFGLKPS